MILRLLRHRQRFQNFCAVSQCIDIRPSQFDALRVRNALRSLPSVSNLQARAHLAKLATLYEEAHLSGFESFLTTDEKKINANLNSKVSQKFT